MTRFLFVLAFCCFPAVATATNPDKSTGTTAPENAPSIQIGKKMTTAQFLKHLFATGQKELCNTIYNQLIQRSQAEMDAMIEEWQQSRSMKAGR